jgi:hypothetical protein
VARLSDAGPSDEVFALDLDTGSVRFGDGVHGKQPAHGATVRVSFGHQRDDQPLVDVTITWPPEVHRYELAVSAAEIGLRRSSGPGLEFAGVKRVRFFSGKMLSAEDLHDEQQYLNSKRYLHNRALHGFGVVNGLAVSLAGTNAADLTISSGLALDRCGREVLLVSVISVPIAAAASPVYVVVDYCDRLTDDVPLAGGVREPTRIEEGASLRLADEAQIGDGVPVARLLRTGTTWAVDASYDRPVCGPAR